MKYLVVHFWQVKHANCNFCVLLNLYGSTLVQKCVKSVIFRLYVEKVLTLEHIIINLVILLLLAVYILIQWQISPFCDFLCLTSSLQHELQSVLSSMMAM